MRRFRYFLSLAPLALTLASGCMTFKFLSVGEDQGGGGATMGSGGDTGVTMTAGTSGSSSSGTGAGTPILAGFGYMCGGSAAECVPGSDSSQCAPGGPGSMGGSTADAGAKLTCQLIPSGDHATADCGLAGSAGADDPCTTAADCKAGLGCGATTITGICRPYCCGDPELCPTKTYCTPTAMAEADVDVPLCVPVKPCDLLGDSNVCGDGEACTIVRADGTTSCVVPGTGTEGEACPCAAGHVCSNVTGTCLKLCHLDGDECGPTGTCQGGTLPYPDNIGFCVQQ